MNLDAWITGNYGEDAYEPPVCECGSCGAELYVGDWVFEINGQLYCEDCMKDFGKEIEPGDSFGIQMGCD